MASFSLAGAASYTSLSTELKVSDGDPAGYTSTSLEYQFEVDGNASPKYINASVLTDLIKRGLE